MNEEVLSALLDGECSPSDLDGILRRLDREPGLREQLARLSLAREARRGLRINPAYRDLASRVRAALPEAPDAPLSTVTPMPRAAARELPWRPAVALAAAAAFGALAVLALKPEPADAPATTQVAAAPAAVEAPASLNEQDLRELRDYQMSYSETRAHAVGGTLGYARYAAYVDQPSAEDSGR